MIKGFSLLEALIAITVLVLIMATATPLVVNYYTVYRIITAQQDLMSVLRKAQALSTSNQYKDSFGAYIASDKYILFRGSSYASRTVAFDEEVLRPEAVSITGLGEVVFTRLSGRPSATGTITLTSNDITKTITVNDEGRINW